MKNTLVALIAVAASPAWGQAGAGPESRWTFDEGSGFVAADSGPAMNNGQLFQVAVGWTDDLPPGAGTGFHALSFSGGSVWPAVGSYPAYGGNFTIAAWVKVEVTRAARPESATAMADIRDQNFAIAPAQDTAERFGAGHSSIGVSVGTNGITVMDESVRCLLNYDAAITGWTHVAVVVQANRPSLYVNGVLVRQGIVPATTLHPSGDLGCGRDWGIGNYYGLLDDMRVYSRALTAGELQAMMAAPAEASPSPTPDPAGGNGTSGDGSSTGGGCGSSAAAVPAVILLVLAGIAPGIRG